MIKMMRYTNGDPAYLQDDVGDGLATCQSVQDGLDYGSVAALVDLHDRGSRLQTV